MSKADPFDRAVARERFLRREGDAQRSDDVMRLAVRAQFVLVAGWAVVLAGHWWLDGPGTLFTIHAIVFVLYAGFVTVASVFARSMQRRLREGQDATLDFE